jgi:hypothetical protein
VAATLRFSSSGKEGAEQPRTRCTEKKGRDRARGNDPETEDSNTGTRDMFCVELGVGGGD